jgi:hypothetical protein
LAIGTALGLSTGATIVLAIALAFGLGYALTLTPVLRSGVALKAALAVAFLLTVPVNRWLISRGRRHAAVHGLL